MWNYGKADWRIGFDDDKGGTWAGAGKAIHVTKRVDTEALEAMVDRSGIGAVLEALAEICREKAEHLRENWQDEVSARMWDRRASALERTAGCNIFGD